MRNFHVESAVATDDHSVRLRWSDGLEGVVDFSDIIMDHGLFKALRDPDRFRSVQVAEYGHTIYWLDDDGSEIDICPDVLRAKLDPKMAAWIAEQERLWHASQAAE